MILITISTSIVVGYALTHLTDSQPALLVLPAMVVGIAATISSLAPVLLSNSGQFLLRNGTGLLPMAGCATTSSITLWLILGGSSRTSIRLFLLGAIPGNVARLLAVVALDATAAVLDGVHIHVFGPVQPVDDAVGRGQPVH